MYNSHFIPAWLLWNVLKLCNKSEGKTVFWKLFLNCFPLQNSQQNLHSFYGCAISVKITHQLHQRLFDYLHQSLHGFICHQKILKIWLIGKKTNIKHLRSNPKHFVGAVFSKKIGIWCSNLTSKLFINLYILEQQIFIYVWNLLPTTLEYILWIHMFSKLYFSRVIFKNYASVANFAKKGRNKLSSVKLPWGTNNRFSISRAVYQGDTTAPFCFF